MNWFFIALGAPFLWAFVNIADQYLVTKYSTGTRGSGGLVLFSSLVGIFVAGVIWIFAPEISRIPFLDKSLLILAGGITIAGVVLYLFTLEIEDVSAVSPWFLTVPVFGYVFGYIFLGETLSSQQIMGSLVIMSGVFLVSIDFSGQKRIFKWRPATYMLVSCFLISTIGIIFKYVTVAGDFWASSFWQYAGLGVFGLMIYALVPQYRHEFLQMNKTGGKRIFALNTASEIFTTVGNLLTNYAVLLAPVTMVYLVGSFQPAIVLFLTLFATRFFPSIAKEDVSKKILLPKIVSIVIVIVGSAILFG